MELPVSGVLFIGLRPFNLASHACTPRHCFDMMGNQLGKVLG